MKETPIEIYYANGRKVFVKREDLCFSDCEVYPYLEKLRGVKAHIEKKVHEGFDTFGVYDTQVSKAGWGVAAICRDLHVKCVAFYPKHKADTNPPQSTLKAGELGATTSAINTSKTCTRLEIFYYNARKRLAEEYPQHSYMLPLGLAVPETATEVASECRRTFEKNHYGTIICSCGSGTILSGLLIGSPMETLVIGISSGMDKTRTRQMKRILGADLSAYKLKLRIFDAPYEYLELCKTAPPFPASPIYDAKAWEWLEQNIGDIGEGDILFWNIGW